MSTRTPLEQKKHDLAYWQRIHGAALADPNHIDHGELSEQWGALNRELVRATGRDPNAGANGWEPTGGYLR